MKIDVRKNPIILKLIQYYRISLINDANNYGMKPMNI